MEYIKKTVLSLFMIYLLYCLPFLTYAAVQNGYHFDVTLKNGTSVRLYPMAPDSKITPKSPVWKPDPKVNTKPIGGDPCDRLYAEYQKRTKERSKNAAFKKNKNETVKPTYRTINGIKARLTGFKGDEFKTFKSWYYLPQEPRLSFKNNKPEAMFTKFITDAESGKNSAEGGLFHMMVTMGLTANEEKELREYVKKMIPGASLRGMVDLQPARSGDNFIVTSGTLSDKEFAPAGVLTSGRAPTYPGGKAALAGRLSSIGTQLLASTFENPTSDISVTFAYDYIAKTPAYNARVTIDLDRVGELAQCNLKTKDTRSKKYIDWNFNPFFFSVSEKQKATRISMKDMTEAYETLITTGAVDIQIDQNLPDVDMSQLESGLMDLVMKSFTEIQRGFTTSDELKQARDNQPKDTDENNKKSKGPDAPTYEVFTVKRKRTKMQGRIELTLSKTMAIYRSHVITGNMGSELRKYGDQIFTEVVLNDPFFKRGQIYVDLDMDAIDLYEKKMVNNASVQVIVPFKERPFTETQLFTRKNVAEGVISNIFTFATRGIDQSNNRCPFKYIESWSLRGGGKWPADPKPQCSSDMKVTLVPPIMARQIEIEADLGELEAMGFRAADVLLRYNQYGKKKSKTASFRVAKGEGYIEKVLFADKPSASDALPPVEYSIVLTHKTKGALPKTAWQKLDGKYIYANIQGLHQSELDKLKDKIKEVKDFMESLK